MTPKSSRNQNVTIVDNEDLSLPPHECIVPYFHIHPLMHAGNPHDCPMHVHITLDAMQKHGPGALSKGVHVG